MHNIKCVRSQLQKAGQDKVTSFTLGQMSNKADSQKGHQKLLFAPCLEYAERSPLQNLDHEPLVTLNS